MTNGHNPAAGLITASGAPLIQDIKTQRVKLVILTQTFLASILQLDGTQLLKCDGVPEDAECVGMAPPMKNSNGELGIGLLYYHPSFPVTIPGRMPPMLPVATTFYELVDEETDDPSEVDLEYLAASLDARTLRDPQVLIDSTAAAFLVDRQQRGHDDEGSL